MNRLLLAFSILAFFLLHILIGGAQLAFCILPYALLAIGGILSLLAIRQHHLAPENLCLISAALFFGYIIFRSLFSPVEYYAATKLYLAQAALCLYLVFAIYLTKPKERLIFIISWLVLLALHVGIGIYQFVENNDFTLFDIGRFHYGWRASGLFICPNHAAAFLTVAALFCFSITLWSRWPVPAKILAAYCGFMAIIGILLSASRAGALGFIAGLFVLATFSMLAYKKFYRWKTQKILLYLGVGICLVALATFLVFIQGSDQKIISRYAEGPSALDWRLLAWKGGISNFLEAPIFGTGAESHLYYGRHFRDPHLQVDIVHAHNDYIELAAEFGLVGLALFLIFLGSHLWSGARSFKRLAYERLPNSGKLLSNALAVNIASMSAIAAAAAHALFDFQMQIPGVTLAYSLVFAILANPGSQPKGQRDGRITTIAYAYRFLLPIVATWLIVAALPRLKGEYFRARAWVAYKNGELLTSIELDQKSIDSNQKNPESYFFLAEARRQLGLQAYSKQVKRWFYESALPHYEKSIELFPYGNRSRWGKAKILDYYGRFEESDKIWKDLLAWDPNFGELRAHHALHLLTKGKPQEAIEEYKVAINLDPDLAIARAGLKLAEKQLSATGSDSILQQEKVPTF